MAKGRPRIEISQQQFEALCNIMCTEEEIAGIFDCSVDTIENWCKRTYKQTFSEVYKRKSATGKMSLRRKQREVAMAGNTTMLIWLGKQYLGQRDVVDVGNVEDDALTRFLSRIDDEAKRIKQETD